MERKALTLPEIQQAAFEVLKEIARICDEQGFKYFLAYGTLLGAVRHKGVIPWDDDMDVIMPRADFERFMRYMKTEYSGHLKVCDRKTIANYPYGIPRVCDMNYQYVSTNPNEPQFDLGIFVDVYPLDNCSGDKTKAYQLFEAAEKKNWWYSVYVGIGSPNPIKNVVKKFLRAAMHLVKGSDYAQKIDEEIAELIQRETSDRDTALAVTAWANNHVIYDKSWYEKECWLEFNGEKFRAPAGYEASLREDYGDFMALPPPEKRHAYHGYKIYRRGN